MKAHSLGLAQREIERRPFELRRPAGHIAHEVDGHVDINDARDVDELALIQRLELRDFAAVLAR